MPGYYGAIKLLHARQSAEDMDTSRRSGVGQLVSGDEKLNCYNRAIAAGYHYVDMGKIESGCNNFTNAPGLKDEQMKARLVSNEFILGARYLF